MQIGLVGLTDDRCLTVCRTDDQHKRLLLILWQIGPDGSIQRRGDSGTQAGEGSDIAVVRLRRVEGSDAGFLVATASRSAPDTARVRIIVWHVGDDGAITRRGGTGDADMGDASNLSLVARHDGRTLVLSCRDEDGLLLLISLSVSDDGRLVQRQFDTHGEAGAVQRAVVIPGRTVACPRCPTRTRTSSSSSGNWTSGAGSGGWGTAGTSRRGSHSWSTRSR
jgi:hypothetical protein